MFTAAPTDGCFLSQMLILSTPPLFLDHFKAHIKTDLQVSVAPVLALKIVCRCGVLSCGSGIHKEDDFSNY